MRFLNCSLRFIFLLLTVDGLVQSCYVLRIYKFVISSCVLIILIHNVIAFKLQATPQSFGWLSLNHTYKHLHLFRCFILKLGWVICCLFLKTIKCWINWESASSEHVYFLKLSSSELYGKVLMVNSNLSFVSWESFTFGRYSWESLTFGRYSCELWCQV